MSSTGDREAQLDKIDDAMSGDKSEYPEWDPRILKVAQKLGWHFGDEPPTWEYMQQLYRAMQDMNDDLKSNPMEGKKD